MDDGWVGAERQLEVVASPRAAVIATADDKPWTATQPNKPHELCDCREVSGLRRRAWEGENNASMFYKSPKDASTNYTKLVQKFIWEA